MNNTYILTYKFAEKDKFLYFVENRIHYWSPIIASSTHITFELEFNILEKLFNEQYIIKNLKKNMINHIDRDILIENAIFEIDKNFCDIDYQIDKKGNIIKINNLNELINKWCITKNNLIEKYKDERMISELIDNVSHILYDTELIKNYIENFSINQILYSDLYGEIYTKNSYKKQKKILPNFISTIALPIKLDIWVKDIDYHNKFMILEMTGFVNELKIDKENILKMLKYDIPNKNIENIEFKLDYVQEIHFNISNGLILFGNLNIIFGIFESTSKEKLFQIISSMELKEVLV